jgi:hypothetical protein
LIALSHLCELSEGVRKTALLAGIVANAFADRPQRRAALLAVPAFDEKPRAPLRRPAAFPFPDIAIAEPDLEASGKYAAAV